ncbi:MAG: hypothetical protein K2Y32_04270 [Candidatus Obscuribacterales bacterium]|nr:hypothetical protein [Candidatus Obscuribacterales bacterium]
MPIMPKLTGRNFLKILLLLGTYTLSPPIPLQAQNMPHMAQMNEAMQLYQSKNYNQALDRFKAITQSYPRLAMAHYYLALCHQAVGHISQAQGEYQLVMQLDRGQLYSYAAAGVRQLSNARGPSGGAPFKLAQSGPVGQAPTSAPGGSERKEKADKVIYFHLDG